MFNRSVVFLLIENSSIGCRKKLYACVSVLFAESCNCLKILVCNCFIQG